MKKRLYNIYQKYMAELLRFNIHLAVFIVTLFLLWLIQYLQRDAWGVAWLEAVSIGWSFVLIIHFFVARWKRRRFRRTRG